MFDARSVPPTSLAISVAGIKCTLTPKSLNLLVSSSVKESVFFELTKITPFFLIPEKNGIV